MNYSKNIEKLNLSAKQLLSKDHALKIKGGEANGEGAARVKTN